MTKREKSLEFGRWLNPVNANERYTLTIRGHRISPEKHWTVQESVEVVSFAD